MSFLHKEIHLFRRDISLSAICWFALSVIALLIQISKGNASFNNYLIYKGSYLHTLQQINLYSEYPSEYFDRFLYGPSFSFIVAPFTYLPDQLGCFLWGLTCMSFLYLTIMRLGLSNEKKQLILWITAIELMTAMYYTQFNIVITAFMIFSLVLVNQKKDFWATFFIVLGIMTKIYGIAGLAFLLFSERKIVFIGSFLFWTAIVFCLPMIYTTPSFVIHAYRDWLDALTLKNAVNEDAVMQGMSVMRFVKKVLQTPQLGNLFFLWIGAAGCTFAILRFSKWQMPEFRIRYLALLLISIVIFSSSAESSTYIIAMTGVALWYVSYDKPTPIMHTLLLLALILTSLSTTDAFPPFVKNDYVRPYALKALPCSLIWIYIAVSELLPLSKKIKRNE